MRKMGIICAALWCAQVQAETKPIDAFLSETSSDSKNGNQIAREGRLNVPTFLWTNGGGSPVDFRAMKLSPAQAARRYLVDNAERYRSTPAKWAEATVAHVHDTGEGAVIVRFKLNERGVEVFRDEVKIIMNQQLQLVAISGYLTPERKIFDHFLLSPESAVVSAFSHVTGHGIEADKIKTMQPQGVFRQFSIDTFVTPVRVKPVYFSLSKGLKSGFYVELDVSGDDGESKYFSLVVSASTGEVLYLKNLTESDSHSYRVFADETPLKMPLDGPNGNAMTPHPTGLPDNSNTPFVPMSLVTLDKGPISTTDPWLPLGAADTTGNNVKAYADIARPNGFGAGDLIPTPTSAKTFDRLFDPNQNPDATATQRLAATTQLFYNNNFFHDWYYDVGFNEAAGNAQASNLGRGGLGNDRILAEAQDYSGRDNANMSTPSDGASPRMQMYIFNASASGSLRLGNRTVSPGDSTFGPRSFNITGEAVLVNDGTAPVTDACTAIQNSVAGKVAIIDRGSCNFSVKVLAAQMAGAVAAIIVDNVSANAPPTLQGGGATITIPSMGTTLAEGNTLKTAMLAGPVTIILNRVAGADRDGTMDNAIVAHEWGHYISNRLIGDGNGLANNQGRGMGEGWGDFHSMLLVVKGEDIQVPSNAGWRGVYGMAGYTSFATDSNGYYFGIRRVPYSINFAKNAYTFKHIQEGVALPTGVPTAYGLSGNGNSEVHATGEVWATMLWECYAALLNDPRYTFDQARDLMRAYVVAGYKATPLVPTFIEARDAILSAAAARDAGDYASFWRAFARRGMGMKAVGPDRDSETNSPLTEDFTVGNLVSITDITLDDSVQSCDSDGRLDSNESGFVSITVRNVGIGSVSGAQVDVTSSEVALTFQMGARIALPTLAPFAQTVVKIPVKSGDLLANASSNLTAMVTEPSLVAQVTKSQNFRLNFNVMPNGTTTDDVESPMSLWTSSSDPNGNTGSNFRTFASSATSHWWFGPNPSSPADTWLTSPKLNVGAGPLVMTFKHRWDFEADATTNFDGAVIEVSIDNGANFVDVGTSAMPGYTGLMAQGSNPLGGQRGYVGKSAGYPAFIVETVSLGTQYANKEIQVRFRIGSDDAAAAKGWEIDDIGFSGITNMPFALVINDPNTCTNKAPTVTTGAEIVAVEGSMVTLLATAMDPDNDRLQLTWTQKSGPNVTIQNEKFVAPEVTADTRLTFEITVSDGRSMASAMLSVLVKNMNQAPAVSLPNVVEVKEGDTVKVIGTGTDIDGDMLTYSWKRVAGPDAELPNSASDTISFVAPQVSQDSVLLLELVARDATLSSAPSRVEILIRDIPGNTLTNPPAMPAAGCGCNSATGFLLVLAGLLIRRRRSE
jgi:large repetitive protein